MGSIAGNGSHHGGEGGYGQFCPVAMAAEVMAHRWTPLILRELLAGSTHFNEIKRGLPLISRSTLAQRLKALESAGVVAAQPSSIGQPGDYRLTPAGLKLRPVIEAMGIWGQGWTSRFELDNLDAELLMWNLRRRLARDKLPAERKLLRFEFHGLSPRYRRARLFWLFVSRDDVDLCLKDPGADVDLYVTADIGAFARVWLGDLPMAQALREGSIRLVGQREMVRDFPSWLLLSHFAAHSPRLAA
jgi:DNA-binding HxlR family transcriptional regulator